jgi:purine-nucleoside phosphorylase
VTTPAPMTSDVTKAAALLRERLEVDTLDCAFVLGSGFGSLLDRLERAMSMSYADVPGFAPPTVAGHAGVVTVGRLSGRNVLVLAGRFHMYEGHSAAASTFPIRVVKALGAQVLLLSNAAGGIRRTLVPGDLMVINDHINLMWSNPLTGPLWAGDERFPDMSAPYDAALRALLHESARSLGDLLQDGVYAGLMGPSYETPAEVRMLERLGADAIGMSTVPEVIVARAIGLRVAAVSCITNVAAGLSVHKVDHTDVLRVSRTATERFETIVSEFVRRLGRANGRREAGDGREP